MKPSDLVQNINFDSTVVYPMINDLVDSLYTDEINDIIQKSCNSLVDKRSFMMFIIMYFLTFINIKNNNGNNLSKNEMKILLTEFIRNPEKRQKCVELFLLFENSVKKIAN